MVEAFGEGWVCFVILGAQGRQFKEGRGNLRACFAKMEPFCWATVSAVKMTFPSEGKGPFVCGNYDYKLEIRPYPYLFFRPAIVWVLLYEKRTTLKMQQMCLSSYETS